MASEVNDRLILRLVYPLSISLVDSFVCGRITIWLVCSELGSMIMEYVVVLNLRSVSFELCVGHMKL